jgi:hypothetical protein
MGNGLNSNKIVRQSFEHRRDNMIIKEQLSTTAKYGSKAAAKAKAMGLLKST